MLFKKKTHVILFLSKNFLNLQEGHVPNPSD